MNYNVYKRNVYLTQQYQEGQWDLWNPLEFSVNRWVPHIFNDLFVVGAYINGSPELHQPLGDLQAHGGNTILRYTSWIIFALGIAASIVLWRVLPARRMRYLFLVTVGLYATALWVTNYGDYSRYGVAVATQGRYFIPFLIPVMAIAGMAISRLLYKSYLRIIVFTILVLLTTQGAGAMTYILYSKDNWYWSNNKQIININNTTNDVLRATIIVRFPTR